MYIFFILACECIKYQFQVTLWHNFKIFHVNIIYIAEINVYYSNFIVLYCKNHCTIIVAIFEWRNHYLFGNWRFSQTRCCKQVENIICSSSLYNYRFIFLHSKSYFTCLCILCNTLHNIAVIFYIRFVQRTCKHIKMTSIACKTHLKSTTVNKNDEINFNQRRQYKYTEVI